MHMNTKRKQIFFSSPHLLFFYMALKWITRAFLFKLWESEKNLEVADRHSIQIYTVFNKNTSTVNWNLQLGNSRTDQYNDRLVCNWHCFLPPQWLSPGMANSQVRKTVCKIKQQTYNTNKIYCIFGDIHMYLGKNG